MFAIDSETANALLFTSIALLVVFVSAWWLYLSPVRARIGPGIMPSRALAALFAGLLGLAGLQLFGGALWDTSMHIRTGQIPAGADFLWPPHIMIYSGFLIAFVIAVTAIVVIGVPAWRAGTRDPRVWVRRNPYLGAVVLASIYSLLSVPGDALWHELFGEDLTAWSPPHVMLALAASAVIVSAVGLLLQAHRGASFRRWVDLAGMLLLGLALDVAYFLGVVEWELPVRNPLVAARPVWFYPLVGGVLGFLVFILAKQVIRSRWAATGTALAFYLFRFGALLALAATDNVVPSLPLLFLLGAVLIDVVPWQRIRSFWARDALAALGFTAGYAALAFPQIARRSDLPFTGNAFLVAALATFVACLAVYPLADWAGARLAGGRISINAGRKENRTAERIPGI